MAWFKVDDHFWGHPKRLACTLQEVGLWVTAGSWSAQQLTDGFVPAHVLPVLGGRARDAAALVAAGLWHVADGGWRFHDWDAFQPSRESVEKRRNDEAARKQAWRDKRQADRDAAASVNVPVGQPWDMRVASGGTPAGVPGGVPGGVPLFPTRPDPTRPDPVPSSFQEEEARPRSKNTGRLASAEAPDFEAWYAAYPLHVARAAAATAYGRARRKATPAELLAGAMRYRNDPTRGATCHPATWLNQGRWADEHPAGTLHAIGDGRRPAPRDTQQEVREAGEKYLARRAAEKGAS